MLVVLPFGYLHLNHKGDDVNQIHISTGIIPINTSRKKIEEMLSQKAKDRGYIADLKTVSINTPRKQMKVAVCEAHK